MSGNVTLVIGGARSGKSRFAERLAGKSGRAVTYVATAEAWDDEMRERIAAHRADRPAHWDTVEAPTDLPAALCAHAGEGQTILVDCLTLWLTNVMLGDHDLDAACDALCHTFDRLDGEIILVSNEVGQGIVPDNAMARCFRDAQGRLNQTVAARADRVFLISAGLPLQLKPQQHLHEQEGG
ncbi:MAG: bifunctional adenosylcobinamide kinase/adenosylcobinamide-phosphate guanylyltransferase [Pseudomonadota bacterium]